VLNSEHRGAGLYLHVPFCSRICPYCDFAVTTGGREHQRRFVDALVAEIEMVAAVAPAPGEVAQLGAGSATGTGAWAGPGATAGAGTAADAGGAARTALISPIGAIDTVYFGGGTPSALEAGELGRILAAAGAALPLREPWIFLEANPEDVSAAGLRAWREMGVRTLSLGVQAFDERSLRFLGRRHAPEQAAGSVLRAREAGFHTVSVDLIYGLPDDSPERWRATLAQAVELAPDHLSCYQLTVHEGTPFGFRAARGRLTELPDEAQADLFLLTHEFLDDRGYQGYEVSSFARGAEHRSRHNRKYWDHTPYLGLGPSAHSFAAGRRWWNERKLHVYEARVAAGERPVAGGETLSRGELALEALLLGLRTHAGIDLALFRDRHGIDLAARNERLLATLAAEGLLAFDAGALVPTLRGLAVADSLARRLELE
jgi:putative oxygen-independent coproporphyrinogen III oxidase